MASSQVEAVSPVQEITDHAEEITPRPCCAQGQKPETAIEEPKVDVHDEDDDEIIGEENKENSATGDELFKDEEDKLADSTAVSEEKPVPSYGRKFNDLEDDDDDEDHDDEDDDEMI